MQWGCPIIIQDFDVPIEQMLQQRGLPSSRSSMQHAKPGALVMGEDIDTFRCHPEDNMPVPATGRIFETLQLIKR